MADNFNFTPGTGLVGASDDIAGVHYPRFKVAHGADGSASDVSTAAPLPVRDPVKGSALSKGGITSSGSSQQLVAANSARTVLEISNGSTSGVWLAFGSAAVQGQGTYLPSKATGYWPTTAAVNLIFESGGAGGPIGFTEW